MKTLSFVIISLLLNACMQPKKTTSWQDVSFDMEGHRGARGLMPENTIPAMHRAIDEGVTTLEMDVHITKDKQVVLSHDPYFNDLITTTPEGAFLSKKDARSRILFQMDYDSIKKYDVGLKPYPAFPHQQKIAVAKPLLSALIDSSEIYVHKNRRVIGYNIEIKSKPETDNINHPEIPEYVNLVMNVLQQKNVIDRTIIQSFDMRPLQFLHQKYPKVKTSFLIEATEKRSPGELIKELGFNPTVLSPHFSLVTKEFVQACHDKNIRVIPWTVNKLEEIKALKETGVDGIISDYPDLFKKL
ncbi:MAG TPA: glycerophosphodiester phosphodiesterase family protein [Chitinophagaceae bacterium]|jgi:Glycerophosphoryl diester phosphodiesterase